MTTMAMNAVDQLELRRANLRDLITTSGKTLQEVIDHTGIPRATLYNLLNAEGFAISMREVRKIWKACGKPGKMSDLLA